MYSVREAATKIGVSPKAIKTRLKNGTLEGEVIEGKFGPEWQIPDHAVDSYKEAVHVSKPVVEMVEPDAGVEEPEAEEEQGIEQKEEPEEPEQEDEEQEEEVVPEQDVERVSSTEPKVQPKPAVQPRPRVQPKPAEQPKPKEGFQVGLPSLF